MAERLRPRPEIDAGAHKLFLYEETDFWFEELKGAANRSGPNFTYPVGVLLP
jgi:hypothetical protein